MLPRWIRPTPRGRGSGTVASWRIDPAAAAEEGGHGFWRLQSSPGEAVLWSILVGQ